MNILDPTDERVPVTRSLAERPASVSGSIALLDIAKPRGNVLLDRLAERLEQLAPDVVINRYTKPTFTKPAPDALRREIAASNQLVVEALAD